MKYYTSFNEKYITWPPVMLIKFWYIQQFKIHYM